ncbi:hypothetical protein FHS29_005516 [Saccharothrix tamanrassetensis]|uniref:Uncharacterized protein n=1 Tax=Saccharothrix tamanrassetensis TaxID=1051531 RepID=A0A841CS94_9PSEU|nr:hypothetical protein [Saccharothrix tamanrassetensis]MBB5958907.1 hypothetical protein [Saccharothrix tamanrassetensis]
MADRPRSPEPEDDDPSSVTQPVRVFGASEQAPGNPGWTRALADTTTAQREPLADGVEQLPGIDPAFWHGPARERFATARDRLADEWKTVHDAHDAVVRRVDTYSTFVHQLQHLWEADRGNPAALRHTAELHERTTAALAAELLARAAQLDAVAVQGLPPAPGPATEPQPGPQPEPEAEPEPESQPEPDNEPERDNEPEASEPDRTADDQPERDDEQGPDDRPEPAAEHAEDGSAADSESNGAVPGGGDLSTGSHPGDGVHQAPTAVDAPEAHDAPTTPAHRFHLTEKLGVQLQAGVRVFRIPWELPRR